MSKQQVRLKEKELKYNVGDKPIVVRNKYYTEFVIGEEVEVIKKSEYDYLCESKSGAQWWCQDDNFTNG